MDWKPLDVMLVVNQLICLNPIWTRNDPYHHPVDAYLVTLQNSQTKSLKRERLEMPDTSYWSCSDCFAGCSHRGGDAKLTVKQGAPNIVECLGNSFQPISGSLIPGTTTCWGTSKAKVTSTAKHCEEVYSTNLHQPNLFLDIYNIYSNFKVTCQH